MRVTDDRLIRKLVQVESSKAEATEVIASLASSGAILKGHFALQGGDHSSYLFRFSAIGHDLGLVSMIASLLVGRTILDGQRITVLCPETAGYLLGHAIAARIGAPLVVAKVDNLRRPIPEVLSGQFDPGREVVVVNDIVTTGSSVRRLLELAKRENARVTRALVFGCTNRERFAQFLGESRLEATWLVSAMWDTYRPGSRHCPMCKSDEPILPASEFN